MSTNTFTSTGDSDRDLADRLGPAVTAMRIIVLALAAGVLIFAAVVVGMRLDGQPQPPPPGPQQQAGPIDLLTMMALFAAPIGLVLAMLVPAVMVKSGRRQIVQGTYGTFRNPTATGRRSLYGALGDAAPYCALYQVKMIVGAALLEGPALLAVVAFQIEGNWLALGLAVGLAVAILSTFPSASRVANWIGQQQRLVEDEKLLIR